MRLCHSFIVIFVLMVFPALPSAESETDEEQKVQTEVLKKPKFCIRRIKEGDIIMLRIHGIIKETGVVFESNLDSKSPYALQYGVGQLDKSLESSLVDMCAGEKRGVTIPPGGDRENFTSHTGLNVSAYDTLYYEVELSDIQDSPNYVMIFNILNRDKTGKLTPEQFLAVASHGLDMFPMVTSLEEMEVLVREGFRLGDKDGDGLLDLEEFLDSPLVNAEKNQEEVMKAWDNFKAKKNAKETPSENNKEELKKEEL